MNFVELESVLAVYYYRSFKEASRQTATSRHGSTSAMAESAATSRFGLS